MASYTTRIVLLLMFIVILMPTVSALTQKYEANTDASSSIIIVAGTKEAQKITLDPSLFDNVYGILTYIKKIGTPNDLTVELYSVDGGGAPDSVLKTWTYSVGSVGTSPAWKLVASTPHTFSDWNEEDYIIAFSGSKDVGNYYTIYYTQSTNPYAGGSEWYYDGSTWTQYANNDLSFEFDYEYNQFVISGANEIYPIGGVTDIPLEPTMNWTAGSDADGDTPIHYQLWGSAIIGNPWTTSLTYTIPSPLTENTTYNWWIQSYDDWCYNGGAVRCGEGHSSNSFTTIAVTDEAPITNLTVIGYSDEYITWNWTNPTYSGFNKTIIYKNGGWVANITTPDNEVSFLHLDPNTNYTISTRTVDDGGNINATWVNDTQKTLFACGDAQDEICNLNLNSSDGFKGIFIDPAEQSPSVDKTFGGTFTISNETAPVTINYIGIGILNIEDLSCAADNVFTLNITDTSSGLPTSLLSTEDTNCGDIPYNFRGYYYFHTQDLIISTGTEYAFNLAIYSPNETGRFGIFTSGNDYPDGHLIGKNNVSWSKYPSEDISFIIGYTASSIPSSGRNESYVKTNGSNTNDGSSWTYAWDTIEFAMANTFSETNSTIHIATGNYTADTEITTSNLALFWCDTSEQENASRPWCDMPPLNISS